MRFSLASCVAFLGLRRATRAARLAVKNACFHQHPWFTRDDARDDRAVIIGGCGRSGTTVLREMLARHPSIAIGPESGILCDLPSVSYLAAAWEMPRREVEERLARSRSFVEFASALFRDHAEAQGKPRWGDKTPRNVRAIPRLLAAFPRARFIHVLRDGRDTACSLRTHPREVYRNGRLVPNTVRKPIAQCARRWVEDVSAGLAFRGHPRVTDVRYEDLVFDPEGTMRRLLEFIDEPWDPRVLDVDAGDPTSARAARMMNNRNAGERLSPASIGRWKRDMDHADRKDFARVGGELLIALGYATDHSWVNEPSPRPETISP